MRHLRRLTAFLLTMILLIGIAAIPQPLEAEAAAGYDADEVIRVGLLFKKSSAVTTEGDNVNSLVAGNDQTTIGAKVYASGGYHIGYYDGDKAFHSLYSVDTPYLAGAMDREMYVNGNDLYLPGSQPASGRNAYIGAAHLEVKETFSDAASAQGVRDAIAARTDKNVFVAYINGSYRVRLGDYPDARAAAADQDAQSALSGYTLTSAAASDSCVTIVDMQNEYIVFEYDMDGTSWPAVQTITQGQTMRNRGKEYYGGFRFDRDTAAAASSSNDKNPDKRIRLINYVGMQDYVKGVVPYEMDASWPLEALKAQALCARTYAYYNLNGHTAGFDVCGTTCCQVYRGAYDSTAVDQAVDETYGQFITYQDNIIQAVFTSCTGGYTESSENIWGSSYAYLQPVSIPGDADINRYSATVEAKTLGAKYGIGTVTSIDVTYTLPARTVYAVTLHGTSGDKSYTRGDNVCIGLNAYVDSPHFTISGNQSGENLPDMSGGSGRVTTSVKGTSYTFAGAGIGHNVGMSQYGARALANDGWSYDQIVRYFYTGTEITSVGTPPEENPLPEPPQETEPSAYKVTIPELEGASIVPESGCDPDQVEKNGDFRFKLVFEAVYANSTPVVKANGVILEKDQAGIYTIANMGEDQTITVEGICLNTFAVTLEGCAALDGGPSYAYGAPVTVTYLGTDASFERWQAQGLTLTPQQQANPVLSFIMPNNAVHITAVDHTEQLPVPQADLASGTYDKAQQVILTGAENAQLRYTLDGSEPTEESTFYTQPITITASCTLKVRAFADGYASSDTLIRTYHIRTANPLAISVADLTYGQEAAVKVEANPAQAPVSYLYEGVGQTVYPASAHPPTQAGTYKVSATTPATSLYLAGQTEQTFTIARRPVTIIPVPGQSKEYGSADPTLAYTVAEETPLAGEDQLTGTLLSYDGSGTGRFEMVKSTAADAANPNYLITVQSGVWFEIQPRQLLISFTVVKEEQGVALRATLTGALDVPPGGTIQFYDNENEIGAGIALNHEDELPYAAYLWTAAASGTHTLRAVYTPAAGEPYTALDASINDFSIAKIEQTPITIREAVLYEGEQRIAKEYGDPSFTLTTAGGNGTGLVSYRVESGQDVLEVQTATGTVTIKKPGVAMITVTKEADSTYNQATASVRIIVSRQQSVLAISCEDTPYGTAASPQIVGNLSGGQVSYLYQGIGDTVYPVSSTPPQALGTYQVWGVSAQTDTYKSAQSDPVAFSVTKRPVTIVPHLGQFKVFGQADPVLTYSLENGEILPYGESLNGQILQVSGAENTGLYPITKADGADEMNPHYDITVKEGVNFAVRAKELSITLQTEGTATAGQPLTLKAVLQGALPASEPTGTITFYDGEKIIAEKVALTRSGDDYAASCVWDAPAAGEHDLKAMYSPGNADSYTSSYPAVLAAFSVEKRAQQPLHITGVDQDKLTKTYLDADFTLDVSGGSGEGKLTYQVVSGSDVASVQPASGRVHLEKAGSAIIRVTKDADEQYNAVSSQFTLLVEKAPGSIAIACDDVIYGVMPQVRITAQAGAGVISYYYTGTGDTTYPETTCAPVNAGTYEVYALLDASENYLAAKSAVVSFVIEPATPVCPQDLKGDALAPLSDIALPEGWSWDEPETLLGLDAAAYPASYRDDTGNYENVTGVSLAVGIYTYTPRHVHNEDLGIRISGSLYETAQLHVTKVDKGTQAYQTFTEACAESHEILLTRDISLLSSQGPGFTGEINIHFDIGDAYNGQSVILCHITESGLVKQSCIVADGQVGMKTTSLSPFAVLVEKKTNDNNGSETPDSGQNQLTPGDGGHPETEHSSAQTPNTQDASQSTAASQSSGAIASPATTGGNAGTDTATVSAASGDLGEAPLDAANTAEEGAASSQTQYNADDKGENVRQNTGMKAYAQKQADQGMPTGIIVLLIIGGLLLIGVVLLIVIRFRRA